MKFPHAQRLFGPDLRYRVHTSMLAWYTWARSKNPFFAMLAESLRILWHSLHACRSNQAPVRASALTITTILGLVPIVSILSAVAGYFGYWNLLEHLLPQLDSLLGVPLPMDKVLLLVNRAQQIDFKTLGAMGSLTLLVSFIIAMGNVEKSLNLVWGVRRHRSWIRQGLVYTPFLILLVLFLVSLSSGILWFRHALSGLESLSQFSLISESMRWSGAFMVLLGGVWLNLFLLNWLMPYTRVNISSAVVAASLSMLCLIIVYIPAVRFQAMIFKRYSTLYGSMAVIPLSVLLIYLGWLLILFGAATGLSFQRRHSRSGASESSDTVSLTFQKLVLNCLLFLSNLIRLKKGDEEHTDVEKLNEEIDLEPGAFDIAEAALTHLGVLHRKEYTGIEKFVLHVNPGEVSWTEFLRGLAEFNGTSLRREPIHSQDYNHWLNLEKLERPDSLLNPATLDTALKIFALQSNAKF